MLTSLTTRRASAARRTHQARAIRRSILLASMRKRGHLMRSAGSPRGDATDTCVVPEPTVNRWRAEIAAACTLQMQRAMRGLLLIAITAMAAVACGSSHYDRGLRLKSGATLDGLTPCTAPSTSCRAPLVCATVLLDTGTVGPFCVDDSVCSRLTCGQGYYCHVGWLGPSDGGEPPTVHCAGAI